MDYCCVKCLVCHQTCCVKTDIMSLDAKSRRILHELERVGEEILLDQAHIRELDLRRNKNREALRALTKHGEDKTWLCFGNVFLKHTTEKTKEILNNEQQELDTTINKLRDGVKAKVSRVQDLEGKVTRAGFDLVALSKNEVYACIRD
ncbi:PDRG1 [Cordylochernes scorpioides]|uniref:p53 and DNA damage-regulated protein 1 n=1 Tax=Cordylochernes scorpioides TaxID=51811 RepID=A0ABY6LN88_9ARAC|nr:PDRG1 [Cordylochernes scorpioides]